MLAFTNGVVRLEFIIMGFCQVSVLVFLVDGFGFSVLGFWFRVSGFCAALVCGFGLHFQNCFRSFRVSVRGFLISFCLGFIGVWFLVSGFGFLV